MQRQDRYFCIPIRINGAELRLLHGTVRAEKLIHCIPIRINGAELRQYSFYLSCSSSVHSIPIRINGAELRPPQAPSRAARQAASRIPIRINGAELRQDSKSFSTTTKSVGIPIRINGAELRPRTCFWIFNSRKGIVSPLELMGLNYDTTHQLAPPTK